MNSGIKREQLFMIMKKERGCRARGSMNKE